METNEQIRQVLKNALEEELESFLEQVGQMTEGELKHLEEQVVKSSQAIGRKLMEGVLNSRLYERRPVAHPWRYSSVLSGISSTRNCGRYATS